MWKSDCERTSWEKTPHHGQYHEINSITDPARSTQSPPLSFQRSIHLASLCRFEFRLRSLPCVFSNISLRADEIPTGSKMPSMVTYRLLAWTPSLFALLNNQPFLYKYLPFIKHHSGFENDFFSQLHAYVIPHSHQLNMFNKTRFRKMKTIKEKLQLRLLCRI